MTSTLREISKRLIQEGDAFKKIADKTANSSTGASYMTLALAMKTVAAAILDEVGPKKPAPQEWWFNAYEDGFKSRLWDTREACQQAQEICHGAAIIVHVQEVAS